MLSIWAGGSGIWAIVRDEEENLSAEHVSVLNAGVCLRWRTGIKAPGFVGATTTVKAPSWRTQVNTPEDPVSVNSRDTCFKYAYLGGQAGQARLERGFDLERKDQACLPKPRNTRTQQGGRTTCKEGLGFSATPEEISHPSKCVHNLAVPPTSGLFNA